MQEIEEQILKYECASDWNEWIESGDGKGEREVERERETETESDRPTDRQTDRLTDRREIG